MLGDQGQAGFGRPGAALGVAKVGMSEEALEAEAEVGRGTRNRLAEALGVALGQVRGVGPGGQRDD